MILRILVHFRCDINAFVLLTEFLVNIITRPLQKDVRLKLIFFDLTHTLSHNCQKLPVTQKYVANL